MSIIIRREHASNGASALVQAINDAGGSALLSRRDTFQRQHLILNWGGQDDPVLTRGGTILNKQSNRRVSANKLMAFAALQTAGVPVPLYWTDKEEAIRWRNAQTAGNNPIVLARSTATGSGGVGITVCRRGDDIPTSQFYCQYIRKTSEFRAHIIGGECVAVQQKRAVDGRNHTTDELLIRNHDNGWVFAVNNVDPQQAADVGALGVRAAFALGLDFAAVDIIRARSGELFVLEANTKPGLESPTVLSAYANRLMAMAAAGV